MAVAYEQADNLGIFPPTTVAFPDGEVHELRRISPHDERFADVIEARAAKYAERNGRPEYADQHDQDPNRAFTFVAGVETEDGRGETEYNITMRLVLQDTAHVCDALSEFVPQRGRNIFQILGGGSIFDLLRRTYREVYGDKRRLRTEEVAEITRLAGFAPLLRVTTARDFLLCLDGVTEVAEANDVRVLIAVMQDGLAGFAQKIGFNFHRLPLSLDRSKMGEMFRTAPYYFFAPDRLDEFAMRELSRRRDQQEFKGLPRAEKARIVQELFQRQRVFRRALRTVPDGASLYFATVSETRNHVVQTLQNWEMRPHVA